MASYGECEAVITETITRLAANRNRLSSGVQTFATAKADLDSIPVTLKPFFDTIAGLPSGPAADVLKDKASILLAECAALSDKANSYVKATDGVG